MLPEERPHWLPQLLSACEIDRWQFQSSNLWRILSDPSFFCRSGATPILQLGGNPPRDDSISLFYTPFFACFFDDWIDSLYVVTQIFFFRTISLNLPTTRTGLSNTPPTRFLRRAPSTRGFVSSQSGRLRHPASVHLIVPMSLLI